MKIQKHSTVINNSQMDCGKIVKGSHWAAFERQLAIHLPLTILEQSITFVYDC